MQDRKLKAVIVDDDPSLLKLVSRSLQIEGFETLTAADGVRGLQLVRDKQPDMVILDVMMPGMDGFEVCQRIRVLSEVPIIMLTARDRTDDITHGLNLGADDYVTKPFSAGELLARVKAVLRRSSYKEEAPQPPLVAGKLSIDFASHQVSVEGREVVLTPTEFRVLGFLARHAGKYLTQDQILTEAWGEEYVGESHLLQVTVNRLRKKIGDDPAHPEYILTRIGIGYMFREPP